MSVKRNRDGIGHRAAQRTSEAVSNLRLLAVTNLPVIAEQEPNDRHEQAQSIAWPAVLATWLDHPATDVERFRFRVPAGQRLVFATETRRLGLSPDLLLRLRNAQGRELEYRDNTPGLHGDERLDFTFAESGEYTIEIHDADFGNLAWTNLCCLKVGDLDYAREVFPLGGRRGETVRFTVTNRDGRTSVVEATVPDDPHQDRFHLPLDGFHGSLPWNVAIGELPEIVETPPVDGRPQRLDWPVTVNGRIAEADEQDVYRIPVEPGRPVRVFVEAHDLGSALDGSLLISDPLGKKLLAQSDDRALRGDIDPAVQIDIPDGVAEIHIALRDTFGRGGVGYGYRLTVEPGGPDFSLALGEETFAPGGKERLYDAADTLNLPIGRAVKLPITVFRSSRQAPDFQASRQGFEGEIRLTVQGLPRGVTAAPAVVPAGASRGELEVTASAEAPTEPFEIVVVGKATREDGTVLRRTAERRLFLCEPQFAHLSCDWRSRKVVCVTVGR